MIEVWPACLTAGGTFAIMQFVMSNFHGPWLVDIVSAAVSMIALVVLMRFWKPADEMINATPDGPGRHRGDARGHRSRLEGVAAVDLPHRLRRSSGASTP